MEVIKNPDDVDNLNNNRLLGNPELTNSEIQFNGINNILVCEGSITLKNSKIIFQGNNSIVYLSYTKHDYNLNVFVRSDSTIFIGKNNEFGSTLNINIQEHQNLIIGDDGAFGNGITIRTCDAHPIYDLEDKKRINFSESIFIGDHVWVDHFSYIPRGVKIGSGAIVGIHSVLPPSVTVKSNTYVRGNPTSLVKGNVFFTKDFTGVYGAEDTLNFAYYKSDVFQYENNEETLSLDEIDDILKDLTVDERLDFIEKLFIKNKRKNRFYQ